MKALKALTLCLFVPAALVLLAATAWAAPLLDITNGPITPDTSWTGPTDDPHAAKGQWFQNLVNGEPVAEFEVREYEFYDNLYEDTSGVKHGGGSKSTDAIEGIVTTIGYTATNITSFTIKTTITNDTPGSGHFSDGDNSHNEQLKDAAALSFDMYGVKLTADFAVYSDSYMPTSWDTPYRETDPFIYASDPDQLAWYCWTPESGKTPVGGFWVPTYDFPDIPVGQSATRELSFTTDLPSTDSRYDAIVASYDNGGDIFLNRSTSLKISDWVDDLLLDPGTAYPGQPDYPLRSSDVSVFCTIPEPGELVALAGLCLMGALGYRRRKRTA